MKKYLILHRAPVSAREQMASATPERAKAGMDAWMGWAKQAGPAIVDMGAPLGDPIAIGGKAGTGHIGGYGVVQASSEEEARKLFDGHPHLIKPCLDRDTRTDVDAGNVASSGNAKHPVERNGAAAACNEIEQQPRPT